MINLDQIKLLESKVIGIIEKAAKLTENNFIITQQNEELKIKLEANQNRIDELEMLITGFREDQGKIEETILATLDKINKFGEMISKNIKKKPTGAKTSEKQEPLQESSIDEKVCFEIPESPKTADIPDPLDISSIDESSDDSSDELSIEDLINESEDPEDSGELEIF